VFKKFFSEKKILFIRSVSLKKEIWRSFFYAAKNNARADLEICKSETGREAN